MIIGQESQNRKMEKSRQGGKAEHQCPCSLTHHTFAQLYSLGPTDSHCSCAMQFLSDGEGETAHQVIEHIYVQGHTCAHTAGHHHHHQCWEP